MSIIREVWLRMTPSGGILIIVHACNECCKNEICFCTFQILSLENLALIEPGATIWDAPKEYQDTRMSRFAVASVTYLLFGFFQWFVNVFIVERCIIDHFRNFMDLCSISNVSHFAVKCCMSIYTQVQSICDTSYDPQ